jgi:hypothetical protein
MEFVTFRKYPQLETAKYVVQLLEKNDIANEFIQNKSNLDRNFSSPLLEDFEVKILSKDFELAEKILLEDNKKFIASLPEDYYLYSFSNEELKEVISKKDEWSEIDFLVAIEILNSRGVIISEEEIEVSKKQRLQELKKPEKNPHDWIFAGYVFAFLGGLLGILIGYFLWKQKKTLPDGSRVYEYVASDRIHGKRIFKIGIIVLIIGVLYQMIMA